MTRLVHLAPTVLLCGVLLGIPASAEDPPKKLTQDQREAVYSAWEDVMKQGLKAHGAGKPDVAVACFKKAVLLAREVYPKSDYPYGHPNLALTLDNLAQSLDGPGKA